MKTIKYKGAVYVEAAVNKTFYVKALGNCILISAPNANAAKSQLQVMLKPGKLVKPQSMRPIMIPSALAARINMSLQKYSGEVESEEPDDGEEPNQSELAEEKAERLRDSLREGD